MSKNLVHLHGIVVILAFTAILGKLISRDFPADMLVLFRMGIACAGMLIYMIVAGRSLRTRGYAWMTYMGVGAVVAMHWISFFYAIKVSNVSVTLGCFASSALFTSLLEPLIMHKRVSKLEVGLSIVTMAGLYLIFRFEWHYWEGIIYGLLSAFLAGLFTVLNKKLLLKGADDVQMSFYEMAGGVIILILLAAFSERPFSFPPPEDFLYLLILGLVCTSFAFVVAVRVMKELSAFQVAHTINLEPVYGIFLALLFFGESEMLSVGFYAGAALVLASVLGYPSLMRKKNRGTV